MGREVARRLDRGIEQHGTAADALGDHGGVEAAERAADHGHAVVGPSGDGGEDLVDRGPRRWRQLWTVPDQVGPMLVDPRGDAARLGRLRRRAKAVQVEQMAEWRARRRAQRSFAHAAARAAPGPCVAPSADRSFACTPPKLPLLMHSTWSPGRAAATMRATSSSMVLATTARAPSGRKASAASQPSPPA